MANEAAAAAAEKAAAEIPAMTKQSRMNLLAMTEAGRTPPIDFDIAHYRAAAAAAVEADESAAVAETEAAVMQRSEGCRLLLPRCRPAGLGWQLERSLGAGCCSLGGECEVGMRWSSLRSVLYW